MHVQDEVRIPFSDASEALLLFGPHDAYLKLIEEKYSAKIMTREGELVISGDKPEVDLLTELITILLQLIRRGIALSERDISYAIMLIDRGEAAALLDVYDEEVARTPRYEASNEGQSCSKTLCYSHGESRVKE